jgi:hypothetical protein
MKQLLVKTLAASFSLLFLFVVAQKGYPFTKIRMISKEELKTILDDPGVRIVDVRRDWESSGLKIKGAVREDPLDVKAWAGKYPKDGKMILYCA